MSDSVFGDLRRLADWLTVTAREERAALRGVGLRSDSTAAEGQGGSIAAVIQRLGRAAVPLLGRELRGADVHRRQAARHVLTALAATGPEPRARVIAELRAITTTQAASRGTDEVKVCALELLAALGEHGVARFADPTAIQQRAAGALAAQLASPCDVALAADLMLRQLSDADIGDMVEVMADVAPAGAARLAAELAARLDASTALRDRIATTMAAPDTADPGGADHRAPPPPTVSVLVDAAARLVVVAHRKVMGERRWRHWAVLIDAEGRIDECLLTEGTFEGASAELIARLVAEGYGVASDDVGKARAIVASAARLTAAARRESGRALPALGSPYYVGRDLLDLGDAHLGGRTQAAPRPTLARAVELLAAGDAARAHALLLRHDPQLAQADVAAAAAACLLAQGRPAEALAPLARALAAEPEWPLHHWNHAAALHALGDATGTYHALRRFLATSAMPSGLDADADHPARIALAERLASDLERASRLRGAPLKRARRKRVKS